MEINFVSIIFGIAGSVLGALVVLFGWTLILGRKIQIIDDLKSGFCEVKQDIKILIDRVGKLEGTMTGVVGRGSPLSPTALGAKYIKESGLEKILDDEKNNFIETIKSNLSEGYTGYDVQEVSRRFLMSLKDDPKMVPVKTYAFQNGLEVEVILGAGALWLRDDFLGMPRRISPEETKI